MAPCVATTATGRSGVETLDEANQFPEEYWITAYNTRFAEPPAQGGSAYCPMSTAQRCHILAFRYQRVVTRDHRISLGDVEIEIPPGPKGRSYAKARVDVRQHTDGTWTVYHRDRVIATHGTTPLRKPERIRIQRRGRGRVRGAKETLLVYLTPDQQELAEEVARSQ